MIPYGRHDISQADIDAVIEVLHSNFLTQGPTVPRFEDAVAEYCDAQFAIAVNSATSALHIACLALDLGPEDWLWTSPNTFVATANCALYCGANIDFVDIDPLTYNMSTVRLEEKLQAADKEGRLPKVVIPVHFAGQPSEMAKIHALSEKYGFYVIEDASHAIGASYDNIKIGACRHSCITVFSFHPVKIITTGEGGMAVTNDEALAERLSRLRTHGITADKAIMRPRSKTEIWNYQQIELGFNYRMTDMEAALGLSQLKRVDEFVSYRNQIAARYDLELRPLPVTTPHQTDRTYSSYHLYPIRIDELQSKKTQRQLYDGLRKQGVAVNLHYIPVHRQPYYEKLGFKSGDFPEAEKFHREVISLPIYPKLTKDQHSQVLASLRDLLS